MSVAVVRARPRNKARLFSRQKQLLLLLDALGGSVGRRDFQKLLFLYCQESRGDDIYEFVPYKYGAFSFTSYNDYHKLIGQGLLADDRNYWRLTDEGCRIIGSTQDMHLTAFVQRYRKLRGDALVAETYRRFPYYAIRSEIAVRVLAGDRDALRHIDAARPKPKTGTLSTIGYEGRTLEGYLNALLQAGVTLLCDVRRNPISRKYGFSKSSLSKFCRYIDIRYEHLPELGITSEKRRDLGTQADYDKLFAEYERKCLPKQGEALNKIRAWMRSGEHVALTCYERLPEQCHRGCVAKALMGKSSKRVAGGHL